MDHPQSPSLPPGFSEPRSLDGGSGNSWRARYRGVQCVVRLSNPEETRDSDQAWAELAGLAALEPHPGIARLLDHGEWQGQLWLAREWIIGEPLAARAARGVTSEEVARIAVQLSSALESLHRAGLVHGDIKAENVICRADGAPVLTDLGSTRLKGSVRQTAAGTQFSMAPELVLGHELDARADVFSLGVMLAALLLPPPTIHAEEFYAHFPQRAGFFEAARWSTAELPAWASGLVEQCVARSAGDRPQSALEVGAEIARRCKLPSPSDSGAFELKLGPRSGREEWFAEFVESAKRRADGDSSTAITLRIHSAEPLSAFERELRLDTTLAGVVTHSILFEPRRLEGGAALDRFIEEATPEGGGHVFFVDREFEDRAADSWRDAVLAELRRSANKLPGLHLIRITRSQSTPVSAPASWAENSVPSIGKGALEEFLRARLENGNEEELVRGLAGSLHVSGQGSWERINAALDVAKVRGWLAPGERAPHVFEARFEESLLPLHLDPGVRLSPDAHLYLAVLHAREGRSGFSALLQKAGVEDSRRSEVERELLLHSLVLRDGARLLPTDRGHALAHAAGDGGLPTAALEEVLLREAEEREKEGEDAGEICLLRLRSEQPGAAGALVEHAAQARERGAPARALDWLQRALDLGLPSEEERTLLLGEWCVTQAALGRPEDALETCRELESRGAVRAAARTLARVHTIRRDFEAAQNEWQRAASDPSAGEREKSEALFGEVRFLAESGRRKELEERIAEMVSGRHGALDPRQLRNARSLLAAVRLRDGELEAGTSDLRRLLTDAREASDRALEAGVSLNLGTALRRGADEAGWSEALTLFESAARIHAEDGHLPGLAQARAAWGGTLRDAGRVTEAVAALRSALSIRERLGDARGAAGVRGMLGLALADRGEVAAAELELERAANDLRIEHQQPRTARLFEARAELIRAQLGRRERYHFDPSAFDVRRDDPRSALDLGRAAVLRGRLEEARTAFEAARDSSRKRNWTASSAEACHLLDFFDLAKEGESPERSAAANPALSADRRLLALLTGAGKEAEAEEELLRLARELETGGRRDRAARAWYALAKRTRNVERAEHAHSSAEREFRACTRGLVEAESQRLKKALLGIPDPCPGDLEEMARAIPGRREEELQALLDIQARLVDQEDLPSLLGSIVECSLEIVGGERGFLLLEEEGELVFDTALDSRRGEDIAAPEVEVSRSIIRRALEVGRPLRLSNATADPLLSAAPSVTALELRSILCTPFVVQPRLRGVIYLDHRLRTGAFGDRAEELLVHLAGQAALAIRQVRRVAEIRRLNEKLSRRVIDAEADLQSARRALEDAGLASAQKSGLVGRSEGIRGVRSLLERAAPSRLPVLIQGQSGTGKELAARALHEQSGSRRSGPFVSESCAALPESLIESELFGYRRGAFTGAEEDRPGIFERAHGGTLFLDEIGELPLDLQAKLLRVLETGRVRRIGDAEELRVDFRLVAATNRDLELEVSEGRFRADLRYRLDALRVQMPPLSTRLEDVPLLVEHFLERESEQTEGATQRRVSDSVMAALCRRPWPGNVRELANEVARLCVLSEADLVDEELVRVPAPAGEGEVGSSGIEPLESLERRAILAAVEACGDDKRKAAKELGISRAKIYQKLKAWRARGLIED